MMLAMWIPTWADFYMVCFIVGFVMTFFSLLVGVLHIDLPGRLDNFLHISHGVGHGGLGHYGIGHAHAGAGHGAHGAHADVGHISPFNFSTLMAFLTWFGAAGFLITRNGKLVALMTLGLSMLIGMAGGSIVFWYLTKFLLAHDKTMDPADFEMVGVIGKLTVPIRADGTGEIVYTQGGTRKSLAACSADGSVIGKQEEVVVMSYEKGIAYVRPWKELTDEQQFEKGMADKDLKE